MAGHVQVLWLLDPKEQAEVQQEPSDVKPRDSFRYNGLIHLETEGVEPAGVGKGAVVVTSGGAASKSRQLLHATTISSNARAHDPRGQ